jgi:flagellar basal body rod protein FlgG
MSVQFPLSGHLTYQGGGLALSSRAMLAQTAIIDLHTQNILYFGMPGYRRVVPMVTSFAETMGPQGVGAALSNEVGRLRLSQNPLDVALAGPGFFRIRRQNGQEILTRDGRFRLDPQGNLLALDGSAVLGEDGLPMRIDPIPSDLKKSIKISATGELTAMDPRTYETRRVGQLAVLGEKGETGVPRDVKQYYVEDSNVFLQQEFTGLMAPRRNFEANRQLFIMQSDVLSRMVQELGRPQ